MKNAFGSVSFELMCEVMHFLIPAKDWNIFRQRIHNTSTMVPGLEQHKHFTIGSGPLPGDQIAANIFRITFKKGLEKWIRNDADPALLTIRPITHYTLDAGKSCYADDLCSKHVFIGDTSPTPICVKRALQHHDSKLNEAVNEPGLFQNTIKKEIICSLAGEGASRNYRAMKLETHTGNGNRYLDQMKYLGSWLAANGSNTPEINARIDSAWGKWMCFKHIWYEKEMPLRQ